MIRRPPRSTRTDTLFPYPTLFRSELRYIEDKLALLTESRPRVAVLNADDPRLAALALPDSEVRWFGRADGWHMRGDALHQGDEFVVDNRDVPVPGPHNHGNLCAVLTQIEAPGLAEIG